LQTAEEYWVSGVKKSGLDRHWAGSGKVSIQTSAVEEYLPQVLESPDPARFHALENEKLPR